MRRSKEAKLEEVSDPRDEHRIKHPLSGVLQLGVLGLATKARSIRTVELRSTQLDEEVDEAVDLDGRISDNAFGLTLRRLEPYQLHQALHRSVEAEWNRNHLRPTELSKSTVAIDGKQLTTLTSDQVRQLVSSRTELHGEELSVQQLKQVYARRFPEVQLRDDDDAGLIGVVTTDQAMSTANDVLEVASLRTTYPESASEQFGINLQNGKFEISADGTSLSIGTNVYDSSDSMRVVLVD